MSTTQKMYYCETCRRQTVHLEKKPNRVVHFVIGLLTAGLWWLVWMFMEGLGYRGATCTECGTEHEIDHGTNVCHNCDTEIGLQMTKCPRCGAQQEGGSSKSSTGTA